MFISSVTMGSPVSCLAISSRRMPSPCSPWKSYGDVRGLNAPPRSSCAPAALTAFATYTICSSDSTEHGPAIIAKCPPPNFASPTETTVSSGWNLRLQHLKGSETRLTESTISRLSSKDISIRLVSPTRPSTVWYSPSEGCTSILWLRSQLMSWFRFSSGTLCFNTTIMVLTSSTIKNAAQSILCRIQITSSSAHHKLTLLSGDSKVIIGRENRSEHEKTLLMKICDNHSTLDAACQPGGREKWGIRALPPPQATGCPTRPTAYASRLWG